MNTNGNIPTVMVILGATGDLVSKKIVPSLFHLFNKGKLPQMFRVVGFSRREISEGEFRKMLSEILDRHFGNRLERGKAEEFLNLFLYRRGVFEEEKHYHDLAATLKEIDEKWGVCTNKLFYLAVPPQLYENIFNHLVSSGLTEPCSPEEGWTRVIVEKPFGRDLKTAKRLDAMMGNIFREEQVYRIDHYLAKEMLQNILAFRFSNNLFEINWNNQLIEKIEIKLFEKIGVEERGNFYDGIGALRDVGQNHLLQMLALVMMERPADFSAAAIRTRRVKILGEIRVPTAEEARSSTFRAQYEGYRAIKGVEASSKTETYFKTAAFVNNPRWEGVPVFLESGKRMGEPLKEIIITFRHTMPCLCPAGSEHYKNRVAIRLEPKEEIDIQFWSKIPGSRMDLGKNVFNFMMREREHTAQYTEEYERLILDCIAGDQTLFISTGEVQAMWRYIDPIIRGWRDDSVPLRSYRPDTREIIEEARKAVDESAANGDLKSEVGMVGLGKMGGNIAMRLGERGWKIVGYDKKADAAKNLGAGVETSGSLEELADRLSSPRVVWIMLPAGKAMDEIIFGKNGLTVYLDKGDIIVDGGNSFYRDSIKRAEKLSKHGINFVDIGFSGGPRGALYGGSLMIGGEEKVFRKLMPLIRELAVAGGWSYVGPAGAGHFVKMIHNGIEYGMMQAVAEGFAVLKKSKYRLNLEKIADIYNHGSVIESKLMGWLKEAFDVYESELKGVSGSVAHTGEGAWTLITAKSEKVKTKVIEEALKFRIASEKKPDYTGKVLTALRNRFGGHPVRGK
ncbi:MAG: glucose-6-phosphate dehydrogenase [Patescibacteria group bacterium]